MGQELEASANGFLGEFFCKELYLIKFLPGGVQIVRTKNQNIPDVSFSPNLIFVLSPFEKLDIAGDV